MSNSWVPIDKEFRKLLPKDRPYTELEAAFCLQLDLDESSNKVSCAGYAKLWQWTPKKVQCFLKKMEVKIIYPNDTKGKQNQRGSLSSDYNLKLGQDQGKIRARSGQDQGKIQIIDINMLKGIKARSGQDQGKIKARSRATTIDPKILNPKEREKEKETLSHEKQQCGEYVLLSPAEHLALTEKFGAARLSELIEDVNLYCARSGKTYKSYRAAIETFAKGDKQRNGDTQTEVKDNPEIRQKEAIREFRRFRDQGLIPEKLDTLKDNLCKKYKVGKEVFE